MNKEYEENLKECVDIVGNENGEPLIVPNENFKKIMADKEVIGILNNYRVNIMAKDLNKGLTGPRFVDKSIDDYIYASLTQPPIKIIDKCGSDDMMDYIVECPNCGSHICYGTDTYMYAGHIYCSNEGCREEVVDKYESVKRGNKTN